MTDFLVIVWTGDWDGITLGPLKLRFYSLMFVAAFGLGWWLMNQMYKKDSANLKHLDALFIYVFVGTVMGARLGEVLFYSPEIFKEDPLSVFLPISTKNGFKLTGFRGLASHGAAILIPIMVFLYTKFGKQKVPFLWLGDRLSITVALAGFFIRMGNFFNSEIVGKPSHLPWAVIFESQSSTYGTAEVARHPTQIYEAISYLILFFILWFIYKKTDKRLYLGWILGLFTFVLWSIRFTIEFFKEPQEAGGEGLANSIGLGLNNGQLLSIPLIIIGIVLLLTAKNRYYVYKES